MSQDVQNLHQRLTAILPTITTPTFLTNQGLGNEIGFWIFDYPPAQELMVREHIEHLQKNLWKSNTQLNVVHINLFDNVLAYLMERKLLDKSIEMQSQKGDDSLFKALKAVMHMDKYVPFLMSSIDTDSLDIVMLSGVGSVFPMLRIHNLLNSLHAKLGSIPLIVFYPGKYDGQTLKLFDKLSGNNYYRAFKLIP